MEELALDEGVTSCSSLYRTFPLGRVFSSAATKAMRKSEVDKARNLNRNQLEKVPRNSLGLERFSVGVLAPCDFWTKVDSVVLVCLSYHRSPHLLHWDLASSNFLCQGHRNGEESLRSIC